MKNDNRGFTLIELMMVVAIIAVLASIALPQYRRLTGRSRVAACISEASAFVKERAGAVYGDVLPLPSYVPSACASASNATPVTTADLTGAAIFVAKDADSTQISCDWSTTPCVIP